jgi:hypothetical protein
MRTRSALITRKQLNPYEEARAVRAMLDRGLSEDGAAQALGWPKARVTARVKILELPERAQQLIGEGVIPLAAVDQLRAIGTVAPDLLDAVIAYLDDGNAWAAERLMREPGWVLDAALTHSANAKVFAAYLQSASSREIAELRLGKKTEQLYTDAETLHKQLDRYAYGPPQVNFSDDDVDRARAAGVLIEFERGRPIIVDRPLYRELVKTAIKRTHDELQAKVEAATKEKKATRAGTDRTTARPLLPIPNLVQHVIEGPRLDPAESAAFACLRAPREPSVRRRERTNRNSAGPPPVATASSAIASVSTALNAPSWPPRQVPSAPQVRRRSAVSRPHEAVHGGALEFVLLFATSATAACLGRAMSSLVAVSSAYRTGWSA